jgi:hypothetical protein
MGGLVRDLTDDFVEGLGDILTNRILWSMTLTFTVLKIGSVLTWSWFWVVSPIIAPLILLVFVCVIAKVFWDYE